MWKQVSTSWICRCSPSFLAAIQLYGSKTFSLSLSLARSISLILIHRDVHRFSMDFHKKKTKQKRKIVVLCYRKENATVKRCYLKNNEFKSSVDMERLRLPRDFHQSIWSCDWNVPTAFWAAVCVCVYQKRIDFTVILRARIFANQPKNRMDESVRVRARDLSAANQNIFIHFW